MHYDQPAVPSSHYEYTIKATPISSSNRVKHAALLAMRKLEGWCSNYKASTLIDLIWLIKAETVVEIGVFGGKSLVPMAFALKATGQGMVYGIDPWSKEASIAHMDEANQEYWGNLDHNAIYHDLKQKASLFKLDEHITLIPCTSEAADPIEEIDLLHIDGNHSEECSFADVLKWVPLVRSGGIIVFDDVTWGTMSKAPKWLDEHCTRFLQVTDEENSWAIWIKP
jgi:predicted O-methyltransferase YrrM